jgi:hypothetical protein
MTLLSQQIHEPSQDMVMPSDIEPFEPPIQLEFFPLYLLLLDLSI